MPSLDRYWRLGYLEFVLLLAGGAALVTWLIASSGLPLSRWQEVPLPWMISDISGLVIFYLLELVTISFLAPEARHRERLRRRALHGDEGALPLARIAPNTAKAPDIAHEPLVIPTWRYEAFNWYMAVALSHSALVLLLGNILFSASALLGGLYEQPINDFFNSLENQVGLIITLASCLSIFAMVLIALIWWSIWLRRMKYALSSTLVASPDGLYLRRKRRRDLFISWERMRLLEVNVFLMSQMLWQVYTLYGAGGERIEWRALVSTGKTVRAETATPAETLEKQEVLLGLICSRTGLLPRTLNQSLYARRTGVLFNIPWLNLLCLFSYLLLIGFLTLDLMPYAWLNVIVLLTLIACCAVATWGVFYAAMRNRLEAQMAPLPATQPLLPLPPADTSPENVYVFAHGDQLRALIPALAVCFLALADFTPSFLRPGAANSNHTNATFGSLLGALTAGAIALIGMIAVIGIFIIVGLMTKTPATLYASADDLRQYKDKRCTIIPWGDVTSISARVANGKIHAYTVVAGATGITITWPANGRNIAGRRRDYLRVTAGELAALAELRSGKRIIIAGGGNDDESDA